MEKNNRNDKLNISWEALAKPAKQFVTTAALFALLIGGSVVSGNIAKDNAENIKKYETANEFYVEEAFENNPEAAMNFVENVMSTVEEHKKATISQSDLEDYVIDNGYVSPNTAHKIEVNNNHIDELNQDNAEAVSWVFKLGAAAAGVATACKGIGLGKYLSDKSKELGE